MGVLYIILLSLITFPAVVGTLRKQLQVALVAKRAPNHMKVRLLFTLILLIILAAGVYAYPIIFVAELYVQLTCTGSGCAQGGVGLLLFTPLAWVSYGVTYVVGRLVFDGKCLPVLAK
ncbi:MAG: hypothetical protein WC736_09770 [Gallionella sp.]|jgi:hypothetical protein